MFQAANRYDVHAHPPSTPSCPPHPHPHPMLSEEINLGPEKRPISPNPTTPHHHTNQKDPPASYSSPHLVPVPVLIRCANHHVRPWFTVLCCPESACKQAFLRQERAGFSQPRNSNLEIDNCYVKRDLFGRFFFRLFFSFLYFYFFEMVKDGRGKIGDGQRIQSHIVRWDGMRSFLMLVFGRRCCDDVLWS